MPAIEISELSKTFARNGTQALKNVSLSIEPGEIVALIGASGSGKSTLLRHIGGLERGDARTGEGRVAVFGETIQQNGRLNPKLRRVRAGIGFIFQQFNLVTRVSVLTNVVIGVLGRIPAWRGNLGLFNRAEKLQAMRAMHRVGIARYATQRASTLSGGQQQRAAIARALVQGAKLILADEPIASLDPASANRVMATLSDINRTEHLTVLVSLHQVEYAIRYCPRTIAMRNGEIVFDGPSARLTPEFLTELYGAESEELLLGTHKPSPRPKPRGDVLAGAHGLATAGA